MTWSAKCEVQVWRVEVQRRNARCMRHVLKVFAWSCIATWSHAGHVPGRQECNTLAHSAHARAWLAHGACKFYECERSCNISLRQLPPRLVRVLLVQDGSVPKTITSYHFLKFWNISMRFSRYNPPHFTALFLVLVRETGVWERAAVESGPWRTARCQLHCDGVIEYP